MSDTKPDNPSPIDDASSPPAGSELTVPTPEQVDDELQQLAAHEPAAPPSSPVRRRRRPRRSDPTPRVLVILFCLWMLFSWGIALLSVDKIRPTQWMVLSSVICVMAFWPVLRLSQWREDAFAMDNGSADTRRTPRRIFMDWFCLNVLFQTVVWPLHMNAHWRMDQTMWLSLTMAGWSLITGAIIAMGCRTDRISQRMLAVAACLLLLVGEPLLTAFLGSWEHESIHYFTSPLALIWQLTGIAAQWTQWPWLIQTPMAILAGIVAWIIVAITGRWMGSSREPGLPGRSQSSVTSM